MLTVFAKSKPEDMANMASTKVYLYGEVTNIIKPLYF
jgi:hypothetical protein